MYGHLRAAHPLDHIAHYENTVLHIVCVKLRTKVFFKSTYLSNNYKGMAEKTPPNLKIGCFPPHI